MSFNLEGGMKQKEDGCVDFIVVLVFNDFGLLDENIMVVVIVSQIVNFWMIGFIVFVIFYESDSNFFVNVFFSIKVNQVF